MNMREAGSSSAIPFILNSLRGRCDRQRKATVAFTKILSIPYSRGYWIVYPALPFSRDIKGEAATAAAISMGS